MPEIGVLFGTYFADCPSTSYAHKMESRPGIIIYATSLSVMASNTLAYFIDTTYFWPSRLKYGEVWSQKTR